MKPTFTKGEKVLHIGAWDGKNTFYFQRAVVASCGLKKMTLKSESGEMMGCDFYPGLGFGAHSVNFEVMCDQYNRPHHHCVRQGTFRDMTDEEATALCLQWAGEFLAYEIKQLEERLVEHVAKYGEDGWHRSISSKVAELKTLKPAVIKK